MAEALEDARRLIEERLCEIEYEAEQLKQALGQLGQSAKTSSNTRRQSQPRRRARRGRRAARGQRREQFLTVARSNPKAKPTEIATEIGISVNQVYALARRLEERGEIKRSGTGYRVLAET